MIVVVAALVILALQFSGSYSLLRDIFTRLAPPKPPDEAGFNWRRRQDVFSLGVIGVGFLAVPVMTSSIVGIGIRFVLARMLSTSSIRRAGTSIRSGSKTTTRKALNELLAKKQKGLPITAVKRPQASNVVELMMRSARA